MSSFCVPLNVTISGKPIKPSEKNLNFFISMCRQWFLSKFLALISEMTALAICGEFKFMSQYLELAGLELSLYQDCFIP